jgi:hypothetical protein
MGATGLGIIVGLILMRAFLLFAQGGAVDAAGIESGDGPCDTSAETLGLDDCTGYSFGALLTGTIQGMPLELNLLQVVVQDVLLIWAGRGLIASGV